MMYSPKDILGFIQIRERVLPVVVEQPLTLIVRALSLGDGGQSLKCPGRLIELDPVTDRALRLVEDVREVLSRVPYLVVCVQAVLVWACCRVTASSMARCDVRTHFCEIGRAHV